MKGIHRFIQQRTRLVWIFIARSFQQNRTEVTQGRGIIGMNFQSLRIFLFRLVVQILCRIARLESCQPELRISPQHDRPAVVRLDLKGALIFLNSRLQQVFRLFVFFMHGNMVINFTHLGENLKIFRLQLQQVVKIIHRLGIECLYIRAFILAR